MTSEELKNAKFIDIHSHQGREASKDVIIYSYNPGINSGPSKDHLFSIGIHPWSINDTDIEEHWNTLKENIQSNNLVFIGEAGIDLTINVPLETQEEILWRHIRLSEEYKRPLILHVVKSQQEILNLRKESKAEQAWILHDYNGNKQMIEQCLKHNGLYFSIGARFFNSPKSKIAKDLMSIPLDRLFFETDDQTTFSIERIYTEYSRVSNIKIEELKDIIESNFRRLLPYYEE